MKLTIEQSELAEILSRVANVVERRNTIPILANVLLEASGGTLTATGTDLEVSVTTTGSATVDQAGAVTVPSVTLAGVVGKLRKGSLVTLESANGTLSVKSGRSDVKLTELPAADFPKIASDEYDAAINADQCEIARMFNLTAFAMSTETTRYYLNGVYLHNVDGVIRAVSTDGHRLAKADSRIEGEIPPVIVPIKTVGLLRGLLTEGDGVLFVSETKIKVDMGHTVIVSRVIDGTFPEYSRIIPEGQKNTVKFSADDASHAIGLVSLVSQDKAKSLQLEIGEDTVGFFVTDRTTNGTARETVDAELEGSPLTIGLNSRYALDCMALANKGSINVSFGDALTPVVVTYDTEPDFLAVIMPQRI